MKHSRLTIALLVAVFVSLQVGCGESRPKPTGEKITLKLNLAKGSSYKMFVDMDMSMDMSGGGMSADTTMNMGMGMKMDCEDVDEKGVHTLKTEISKITMDMKMDAGGGQKMNISFDSDKPGSAPPQFQPVLDMVGKAFTMRMTDRGEFVDASGLEAFGPQAAQMRQSMDQAFASYPDRPVDLGDSWTASQNMATDPNMPMNMEVTYTLWARNNGKATIRAEGEVKAGGQLNMDGTFEGEMIVDEKTGWVEKGDMTMDVSGSMSQGGQSMKMDMDAKITISGQ